MNTDKLKVYVNTTKDLLKENSGKIAVAVGVVSGIAAFGLAIKKSLSVDEIINEHVDRINEVKLDAVDNPTITDAQYKRSLIKEYLKTCGYLANHYKWPIALELTSVFANCAGFHIEEKKYISASATAAAFYAELMTLRDNVAKKYGEEELFNLAYDVREETLEKEVLDENGKKKKVKEKVKIANNTNPGTFSFFLGKDYGNGWDYNKSDEANISEIKLRLSNALGIGSRDIYNHGYMWMDAFAKRANIEVTDALRRAAVTYDLENFDEQHQFCVDRNVKIHDAHILEGGETVLLVEITGVVPEFKVDSFDKEQFIKDKAAYKERLAVKH